MHRAATTLSRAAATQSGNTFYGDAGGNMSGHAQGGDDTFTGADGNFSVDNHFDGDAKSISEFAKGGNDTLTGGNNTSTLVNGSTGEQHSLR